MPTLDSRSPAETQRAARRLARVCAPGDVIGLCGELGAGKTLFVKGLAAGLGLDPRYVSSPTFTLIHEYLGGLMPLYHFDFYRIETEDEALEIGIEDYLIGDGVCVIEWADKFPALLPPHTRWFHLEIKGDSRRAITERR